jgi:hypothetical protein
MMMPTGPAGWTTHLNDEFDRYVKTVILCEGDKYHCAVTGKAISAAEFAQIRSEVIANATTDATSLAYHMMMESGEKAHASSPCATCDAAIRLAWGVSPMRRSLGLPLSSDIAPDLNPPDLIAV